MSNPKRMALEDIRLRPSCQTRVGLDEATVEEYAEAYEHGGGDFPPLEIFDVSGERVLVDGYHRLAAAIAAGLSFHAVVVVGSGTLTDAAYYTLGVNQRHGLRRSNADKRRCVELALENPRLEDASNRVIAEICGVDHKTVSAVRASIEGPEREPPPDIAPDSGGEIPTPEPRRVTGRDGKSYPATPPAPLTPPGMPVELAEAFTLTRDAAKALRAALKAIAPMSAHPDLARAGTSAMDSMRLALTTVEGAAPVKCPTCRGGGGACATCRMVGWVTEDTRAQISRSAKALA